MTHPSEYLADRITDQRWILRSVPFRHVIARDVFKLDFYRQLEKQFFELFPSSREGSTNPMFKMKGYDAHGINFSPDTTGPMSIFTSKAWHDLMGNLFQVEGSGYINAGLHHHDAGSANGVIHSDLAVGWFADYEAREGIRVSRHDLCRYTDGRALVEGVHPKEMVRAVAMIFYIANPPWKAGDGGETGLYRSISDPVESPLAKVPPINNSMIMFECTPHSFHSYLRNNRSVRNSAIMWTHRTLEGAIAKWNEAGIVRFPQEGA